MVLDRDELVPENGTPLSEAWPPPATPQMLRRKANSSCRKLFQLPHPKPFNDRPRRPPHWATVVVERVNVVGWTKAPLVATSHAANRTHFLPAALNGISKRFLPNGAKSAIEMT